MNTTKYNISIIVPVYNGGNTIAATIESIESQTIVDQLEIIIVDDGSSDDTVAICKDEARKYGNITIIENEHGGVSHSRNTGILASQGNYIGFVDSDDTISTSMYEVLYQNLIVTSSDISMCGFYSERDDCSYAFPFEGKCSQVEKEELMRRMLGAKSDDVIFENVWGSVCRCLYKKEIIDKYKLVFDERIEFAEDLIFTFRYLTVCTTVVLVNEVLYYYTCTKDSLMMSHASQYKNQMLTKRMIVVKQLAEMSQSYNLNNYREYLNVSIRSYALECIGNEFHRDNFNFNKCAQEIENILDADEIKKAFQAFKNCRDIKRKMIYRLMKFKFIKTIELYYYFRVFKRRKS